MPHVLTESEVKFLTDTNFATISVTFADGSKAILVSRPNGYVLVDAGSLSTFTFDETMLTHDGRLLLLIGDRILQTTTPITGICVLEN